MSDAPNDQEVVDRLEEVWSSLADLGRDLGAAEWKQPTDLPGWSVQDNLAHITGAEWWLLGRPAPDHTVADDLPHVRNDIGRANELFVDSRRSWSGAEVLAEFVEVSGARVEQLRGFGPDDFGRESWTPTGPGTLRDLLPLRVFDSWVHEQDMRRAVGRPGDLDTTVGLLTLGRMVDTLPYVVGKKACAPEGTSVVFALTGPGGGKFAVGVDGGRATRLDDAPPAPSVTITSDTETLARLACGRLDPEAALRDGQVRLDGDEALGVTIVESLNVLF